MTGQPLDLKRVVMMHQTVRGAGASESVELAARVGFGGVTIRAVPDGGASDRAVVERMADARATSLAAETAGIRVADIETAVLTPDWRPEDSEPLVEAGATLGATYLNVIAADADRARLMEHWGELCEVSAGVGLRPSLEFMAFSAVATVRDAEDVVRGAGHAAGAIAVDALHLVRSGGTVADVVAVRDRGAAPITCLHLCDGPPEPAVDGDDALFQEALAHRLLPGEGVFPLQALLDALPDADVYVETPVQALADRPRVQQAAAAGASLLALVTVST